MKKCIECGGNVVRRGYEHVSQVGENTLSDRSAMVPTCKNCGATYIPHRLLVDYERKAAEIFLTDPKAKLNGEVVKFVRKVLGLRQSQLAERLGRRPEQISRYEAEPEVASWLRAALLGLLLEPAATEHKRIVLQVAQITRTKKLAG